MDMHTQQKAKLGFFYMNLVSGIRPNCRTFWLLTNHCEPSIFATRLIHGLYCVGRVAVDNSQCTDTTTGDTESECCLLFEKLY